MNSFGWLLLMILSIELDCILNLENLPRTVFIDYECWNLNVVVDGGEVTRYINKKKPVVLQAYKCPVPNAILQQVCEIF